jgi:hypothetical protein
METAPPTPYYPFETAPPTPYYPFETAPPAPYYPFETAPPTPYYPFETAPPTPYYPFETAPPTPYYPFETAPPAPYYPIETAPPTALPTLYRRDRRLVSVESNHSGVQFDSLVASNFRGASGPVSFGNEFENGRDQQGITIGAFNIIPDESGFHATLVSTWNKETGWVNENGASFVYRDGSTQPPAMLRDVWAENFLSPEVRAVGLSLMTVAWFIAFASFALLLLLRRDPNLQQTQTLSLPLLCLGSVWMNTTILTLSADESTGWSDHQLDILCAMAPWFFFLGQIGMITALFLSLARNEAIKKRVVVFVVGGFFAVTTSVLIGWTTLDTWSWNREFVSEIPSETLGQCSSQHQWAFFGVLIGVVFLSQILTYGFAWKMSNSPDEITAQNSTGVMYTCFAYLQAWVTGACMLAALGTASSVDARYFGRVLMIWMFAVSGVILVVMPKIYLVLQERRRPSRPGRVKITAVYNGPSTHGTSEPTRTQSQSNTSNRILPNYSSKE